MSAPNLSGSLTRIGFPLRRFKTGTPARIDVRTIDFDEMTPQPGDEPVTPFSFMTDRRAAQYLRMLFDMDDAGNARHHPPKSPPRAAVFRQNPRHRAALLPVD